MTDTSSTFFDYHTTGSVGHASAVAERNDARVFAAPNRALAPSLADIDAANKAQAAREQQAQADAATAMKQAQGGGAAAAKKLSQRQQDRLAHQAAAAKAAAELEGRRDDNGSILFRSELFASASRRPAANPIAPVGDGAVTNGASDVDVDAVRFARPKPRTTVNLLLKQRSLPVPNVPSRGGGSADVPMHLQGLNAAAYGASYAAARRQCQAAVDRIAEALLEATQSQAGGAPHGRPGSPTAERGEKPRPKPQQCYRYVDTSFFLGDRETLFPEGADSKRCTVGTPADVVRLTNHFGGGIPLFDVVPVAPDQDVPDTFGDDDGAAETLNGSGVAASSPTKNSGGKASATVGGDDDDDAYETWRHSFDELRQGRVGDSHFLAAVSAIVSASPHLGGRRALQRLFVLPQVPASMPAKPAGPQAAGANAALSNSTASAAAVGSGLHTTMSMGSLAMSVTTGGASGSRVDHTLRLGFVGVLFYVNGAWEWVIVDDTIGTGADFSSPTFLSVVPRPNTAAPSHAAKGTSLATPSGVVPIAPAQAARLLSLDGGAADSTADEHERARRRDAAALFDPAETAQLQRLLTSWAFVGTDGLKAADPAKKALPALPIDAVSGSGLSSANNFASFSSNGGGQGAAGGPTQQGKPTELWPFLLEKAYAKLHYSFDGIDGGSVREAMATLLGGVEDTLVLHRALRDAAPPAHGAPGNSSDSDDDYEGHPDVEAPGASDGLADARRRARKKAAQNAASVLAPDVVPASVGGDDAPLASAGQQSRIARRARIADHRAAHPVAEQRNAFGGKVRLTPAQARAQRLEKIFAGGGGSISFLKFQECLQEQDGVQTFAVGRRARYLYDVHPAANGADGTPDGAKHGHGPATSAGRPNELDDADNAAPRVHPADATTLTLLRPTGWYPIVRLWRDDDDGEPRVELYDAFSTPEQLQRLAVFQATRRRAARLQQLLQEAQTGRRSEASVAVASTAPLPLPRGSAARFVTLRWTSFLAAFDRAELCNTLCDDPGILLAAGGATEAKRRRLAAAARRSYRGEPANPMHRTLLSSLQQAPLGEPTAEEISLSRSQSLWGPEGAFSAGSNGALWHDVSVGALAPPTLADGAEAHGGGGGHHAPSGAPGDAPTLRQHPVRPLVLYVGAPVRSTVAFLLEQEDPKVRPDEWHRNRKHTPYAQLQLSVFMFDEDPNGLVEQYTQSKTAVGLHSGVNRLIQNHAVDAGANVAANNTTPLSPVRRSPQYAAVAGGLSSASVLGGRDRNPAPVATVGPFYRRQLWLCPLLQHEKWYLIVPRVIKGPALPYHVRISCRSTCVLTLTPLAGVPAEASSLVPSVQQQLDAASVPGGPHARRRHRATAAAEAKALGDEEGAIEYAADVLHVGGRGGGKAAGFAGQLLSMLDARLGDVDEQTRSDEAAAERLKRGQVEMANLVGGDGSDAAVALSVDAANANAEAVALQRAADRRALLGNRDGHGGVTTKLLPRWSAEDATMAAMAGDDDEDAAAAPRAPADDDGDMNATSATGVGHPESFAEGAFIRTVDGDDDAWETDEEDAEVAANKARLPHGIRRRIGQQNHRHVQRLMLALEEVPEGHAVADVQVQLRDACASAFDEADVSGAGVLRERRHVDRAVCDFLLRHTRLGRSLADYARCALDDANRRRRNRRRRSSNAGGDGASSPTAADAPGVSFAAFAAAVASAVADTVMDQ